MRSPQARVAAADAHNDLLQEVELIGGANPFADLWLDNLRKGGVRYTSCAVAVDNADMPDAALRRGLLLTRAFHQAVEQNHDDVAWVRWREDVERLDGDDRIGLALLMEGAEPLAGDPLLADVFFALGFRIFGLTWSVRNTFGDGQDEASDGGLSNSGRRLVDRIAGLGGIFDLAHASPRTFDQVLERSGDAPVMLSHAGCRAVYDIRRNTSDAQLRSLRDRGGVFSVMLVPMTVDPVDWSIDRVVDHIDHAVSVMGIDQVSLGGDFTRQLWRAGVFSQRMVNLVKAAPGMDGDSVVDGLAGPEDFDNLATGLAKRGYDDASVEKIMGGNLLTFLRTNLPAQPTQEEASWRSV